MFKPVSVGKAQTDPFLQEPRRRIYELAVMRSVTPFESRYYRGLLAVALLTAGVMAAAAIRRRWRTMPERGEWAAPATGIAGLAAFIVVPFWMAGGAYFPQRFAILGIFFLLASAALYPLGPRQRAAVTAGAACIAMLAVFYQAGVERMIEERYGAALSVAPVQGRLGALITEDDIVNPALRYNAQLWAGMPYIRRAGMALLNSPWLDVPDNWLRVRNAQPCQFLNPILMRGCLEEIADRPGRPAVDVLVGTRAGLKTGPGATITEQLARRYGLTRRVLESPYLSIYSKP